MHISDYKKQRVVVRIWRWLRHRPLSILNFCCNVLWFVFVKDLRLTTQEIEFYKNNWDYIKHLWHINRALAYIRMGNCITTEQFIENIEERSKTR